MNNARAILHVTIRGRVQGVGYRAWVEYRAVTAHLEGWVRNRRDGSVEAVFAGAPKAVAEMIALCRHGPPSARVETVLNEPADEEQLKQRQAGEAFSMLSTI
jgi:acylphosphatase